jgi:hypothetical protein
MAHLIFDVFNPPGVGVDGKNVPASFVKGGGCVAPKLPQSDDREEFHA